MITQKKINELDNMQKKYNGGNGICCVKTIILYLKKGKIEQAKQAYTYDNDKLSTYYDVKQWFFDNFGCSVHHVINCNNDLCKRMRVQ